MQHLSVDLTAHWLEFLTLDEQLSCRLWHRTVDVALSTRVAERWVEEYYRTMIPKSAVGCPLVVRHRGRLRSSEETLARFLRTVHAPCPPNIDVLLRMSIARSLLQPTEYQREKLVCAIPRHTSFADVVLTWLQERDRSANRHEFHAVPGDVALQHWAPHCTAWRLDAVEYFTAGTIIVFSHSDLQSALSDVLAHFSPMSLFMDGDAVSTAPDIACVMSEARDLIPNASAVTSRTAHQLDTLPHELFGEEPLRTATAPSEEEPPPPPTFRITKKGKRVPIPPPTMDDMVTQWAAVRLGRAPGMDREAAKASRVVGERHVVICGNAITALAHCATSRALTSVSVAPSVAPFVFADAFCHCDGVRHLELKAAHGGADVTQSLQLHDLEDLLFLPPSQCFGLRKQEQSSTVQAATAAGLRVALSALHRVDMFCYAAQRIRHADLRSLDGFVFVLGSFCFADCVNLEFVALPDSVRSLGDSLCQDCPRLKTLRLPAHVEQIGNHLCKLCNSLALVPSFSRCSALQSLGDGAFSGCRFIEALHLPDNLTSIGADFAYGCARLRTVSVPHCATSLNRFASQCVLLSRVTFRGAESSALQSVSQSFNNSWALTEMTFPDAVVHFGPHNLCDCENLVAVSLPRRLRTLSGRVLCNCPKLSTVNWTELQGPIATTLLQLCEGSRAQPPLDFLNGVIHRFAPPVEGERDNRTNVRFSDLLDPSSDDNSDSAGDCTD